MQIGDTVTPDDVDSGAYNFTGIICGIYEGQDYANLMENYKYNMTPWNTKFPGWQGKKVYIVYFDMPIKTTTQEAWIKQAMSKGETYAHANSTYGRNCPESQTMGFNEDSLVHLQLYEEM